MLNDETSGYIHHALIEAALSFAARAHSGQMRKGTDVPYIVHPVGVMLTLIEARETEPELLAAALLHDTVEDAGVTPADLRGRFGARVAAIVEGCSEPNKRDGWEARKRHTIQYLRSAPRDVLVVAAADKLHNVRSLIADEAALGGRLWTRFKRGRTETAWYYRSTAASLRETELREHVLIRRLDEAVTRFFGDAAAGRD